MTIRTPARRILAATDRSLVFTLRLICVCCFCLLLLLSGNVFVRIVPVAAFC